jgi:hypothetical protein
MEHAYADRLRASEWFVADCDMGKARRLIVAEHYARGTSNTVTCCHGLYRAEDIRLAGAAWWLPPTKGCASATFPEDWEAVLSLSRLAILPDTPKNAATFFLSRSMRLVDARWRCLVTFADTWRGHTGWIYRATGWEDLGLTKPEAVYTIGGRLVSRKAGPKTRTHAEMLSLGATFEGRWSRHKFRFVRKARRGGRVSTHSQASLFPPD